MATLLKMLNAPVVRRKRKFVSNKKIRKSKKDRKDRKQQEMLRVAAWQEETFDELF